MRLILHEDENCVNEGNKKDPRGVAGINNKKLTFWIICVNIKIINICSVKIERF